MGRRVSIPAGEDEQRTVRRRRHALLAVLFVVWDEAEPRVRRLEERHPWPRSTELEVEILERVVSDVGLSKRPISA